jgi:hypothetical protein
MQHQNLEDFRRSLRVEFLLGGVKHPEISAQSQRQAQTRIRRHTDNSPAFPLSTSPNIGHLPPILLKMATRGLKQTALFICDIQERFRGAIHEYPALIK